MDWWEWSKIGSSIGAACIVMAAGTWVGGKLVAPVYPRQQGYAVEGVPPVDLAAAQREWPTGATAQERQQLLGYISNIEHAVVPVAAKTAPAPDQPALSLDALLASADPERGKRTAQTCMACHTLSQGGPNGIGPNLWGVVGRPVASHAGFAYSPAMRHHAGRWTLEDLDHFLTRPAAFVPGTRMGFAGIRNPRERANVLAFLRTLGSAEASARGPST